MANAAIDNTTQSLLRLSQDDSLRHVIASLTEAQRASQTFRAIGEERFLSSLRVGDIDNVEKTKAAFHLTYFMLTKIVAEAAKEGYFLKVKQDKTDVAAKIKEVMSLTDEALSETPGPA